MPSPFVAGGTIVRISELIDGEIVNSKLAYRPEIRILTRGDTCSKIVYNTEVRHVS